MGYFNQDNQRNDRGSYGGGRRDFGGRGEGRSGRGGNRGERRMYPAICDQCGRDCQVPFRPDGSKPIYCSDCFEKKQNDFGQGRNSYNDRGGRRQSNNRNAGQVENLNGEVLASINSKLAQILELMRKDIKPSEKIAETKARKKRRAEKKAKKKKKAKSSKK